jgi:acyl-homoserine lactone acylase PvdQ
MILNMFNNLMLKKFLCYLFGLVALIIACSLYGIFYLYRPLTSGTLYLSHATGEAEVLRETETSIPHIYASSEQMAIFTEGFLHA